MNGNGFKSRRRSDRISSAELFLVFCLTSVDIGCDPAESDMLLIHPEFLVGNWATTVCSSALKWFLNRLQAYSKVFAQR